MYFQDSGPTGAATAEGAAHPHQHQHGRESAADPRVAAEGAHWQVVQVCLDAYVQRMSASQSDLAYIYDLLLNLGSLLLKAYAERLAREAGLGFEAIQASE